MTTQKLSASNFREPLLRTLGGLTEYKANQPVQFKETYDPVCRAMGITVDQYGTQKSTGSNWVEKWIQWAFRTLRKEGLGVSAGRGQWALTTQGALVTQTQFGQFGDNILQNQISPTTTPTPKAAISVPVPVPGVSLDTGPGKSEIGYHSDPYIRALAVQNTKCFSYHTTKGGALCERCPLRESCKNAMAAKFSLLARTLAAEDAEAKRKAAQAKDQSQMQTAAPVPIPAPTTPTPQPAKTGKGGGAVKWGEGHQISIQQQSICRACGQEIQQGVEAVWVRASTGSKAGLFHIECYGD